MNNEAVPVRLARMEEKLDRCVQGIDDYGPRIGALENWKARVRGIVVGVGAVGTIAGTLIGWLLGR